MPTDLAPTCDWVCSRCGVRNSETEWGADPVFGWCRSFADCNDRIGFTLADIGFRNGAAVMGGLIGMALAIRYTYIHIIETDYSALWLDYDEPEPYI